MYCTAEIMSRGMDCLVKHLGDIEAQQFISTIMREKFDYTAWQQEHFDVADAHALNDVAADYEMKHPFRLDKKSKAE